MVKINKSKFLKAMIGSGGNQSKIAQKLDCTRGWVTVYLSKHPDMKAALEQEAEKILDVSENIIDHDIMTNRNIDSAKWKLTNSRRGKARGYGVKIENEVSGAINSNVKLEIIDKTEDVRHNSPNN